MSSRKTRMDRYKDLEEDSFELFVEKTQNKKQKKDEDTKFSKVKEDDLGDNSIHGKDLNDKKLDDIFSNSGDKMSNTFIADEDELNSILKDSKKKSKKMKLWQKIIVLIICLGLIFGSILGFLLYGPYPKFRNWLITTAMTTMNHQYLAKWFYSDKTIDEVLKNNYVKESGEDTDTSMVTFVDYSKTKVMYKNKYEKEILTKEKGNDLYKLININEDSMRGYLVVIYDPAKVRMETASSMGTKGEMLVSMAKRTESVVAMNASGFIDPNYNSNGGRPYGVVIKNGKIVSNLERANVGGGLIGFTNDNKLILGKMSGQEALKKGVRDAMEFGPYLIVNGKPSFIKGNGGWGTAPRSAIGQRQDGIVLFLVMDGRDYAHGIDGVGMVELTEILAKYGAYNASNLDGGTSSGLVINGELINKPVNGSGEKLTRAIPNAWVVSK
ncbi:MAG: phosphodiester glycosidase family protein [Bacilli bacterium]|nr:phosphodiester glycosidase family protein [Bacilli bacterium]